ncbi:hypothetical protein [Paenibacillus brasilensis]|uniref:Uncharacterized protein n=1 Tax=Paenibacillus brasilensis TaxID=128574 RepID=A0ABU0L3B3_9BACL|nr:hypothetical protein [Paenibacillus brasilensis]MDQ0495462.1 hypothetical protein [Paenibacillus brasilensis]
MKEGREGFCFVGMQNYAQEDAFWLKLLFAASIDRTLLDLDTVYTLIKEGRKIKRLNR